MNNYNYNSAPYGYGVPNQQYGFNGQFNAQPQPEVKFNNILSNDEIARLRKHSSEFSLDITDEELLRAKCNHRSEDGLHDTIVMDEETGIAECAICHHKFKPVQREVTPEILNESVQNCIDIVQTIKLLFPNIPKPAADEYFKIIPMMEKLPKLFQLSVEECARHQNLYNNNNYYNRGLGTAAQFQNLAALFNGAMMGNYQQPNNFYNQANPAPGAYGFAGNATPQGNPFGQPGGPAPAPGYAAPNPGYQYNPNFDQATAPVQPSVQMPNQAAPVIDGEAKEVETVTKQETFNV